MNATKVIGIGSPFGADQLGWLVIDEIISSFDKYHIQSEIVSFEKADRPGFRLLDMMKDAKTAILVDAIDNKQCAGQIIKLDKSQIKTYDYGLSSHYIGISETLCLGEKLGQLPANIHLIGICVDVTNSTLPDHCIVQKLAKRVISTLNNIVQPNIPVDILL